MRHESVTNQLDPANPIQKLFIDIKNKLQAAITAENIELLTHAIEFHTAKAYLLQTFTDESIFETDGSEENAIGRQKYDAYIAELNSIVDQKAGSQPAIFFRSYLLPLLTGGEAVFQSEPIYTAAICAFSIHAEIGTEHTMELLACFELLSSNIDDLSINLKIIRATLAGWSRARDGEAPEPRGCLQFT